MKKLILLTIAIVLMGAGCVEIPIFGCTATSTVKNVEIEIVPSWGADDDYYIYTYENGDKESFSWKTYTVGEEVCLKKERIN